MKNPEKALFERYIIGWTQVSVKGGNIYGFVNKLRAESIVCRRQSCKGDCLYFIIRRSDKKRTMQLAESSRLTITLQDEPSLFAWLSKYRWRIGIPIGIILGAGLLVYCSNVVMVIEFQGNEAVTDSELLAALEECSVRRGTFIGDVDFYRSELYIRSAFDEIAWVGMRHTGNRLVVEVMETSEKPEMLRSRIPCHIVAEKTAQITNANVSCGQLMYSEGSAVKEGEVIVSGIWTDEYGHMKFSHSMAEITGIYEEQQTFICDAQKTKRTFSGEVTEQKTLDLFSIRIPLSFEDNPYTDYNIKTQETPLTLFGAELPISLERTLFMEYETSENVLTPDEMREDLQAQQERYEENFLEGCKIISRKCRYTEKETAMVLTVSYTLEGEIGTEKELLLKDNRKPYVAGRYKDD